MNSKTLAALILSLAALLLPPMLCAAPLTVGSIGEKVTAETKKFLPLARYLADQLSSAGFQEGKVAVARTIPTMAALLRDGKVDLYIDSPFPALAVSRLSGSKLLLRRWKGNIGEYHGVIFVRQTSGIGRLTDLKGKMIVLENPYSTTGYFFPKLLLLEAGLSVAAKGDLSSAVSAGEVGYFFSYDETRTLSWVVRGNAAAGAMDHQSYLKLAKTGDGGLKIIERTPALPRHLVSHRPDLAPELAARVRHIFIEMANSAAGRKVLRDFEETTRFDPIPSELMEPLLKAEKFIEKEVIAR